MNAPDAIHCTGCGYALGLEPAGDADHLGCPHCEIELEVFRGAPGALRDCGACGGQFVEHALLRDLIERRELYGIAVPRHARRANPLDQPVRYVPCPVCKQMMHRKNFGGTSGIIVDMCHAHGTWFDTGELPHVLSFVESGGLAQARRREIENLARQKAQAPRSLPTAPLERPLLLDAEYRAHFLEDVAECAAILLDAVVRLFTGQTRRQ
jgi:Zn-finger nucleic acid-binding protein